MSYTINPRVIFRKIDGEYYILEPDDNMFINFNEIGNFIFEKITEGKTDIEIINAILETYQTDSITAKNDLKEFVDELKNLKIIR